MAEKEYIEAKDLQDFRDEIMNEFLSLCNYNDYNKLTLLGIGETIDKIFDKYYSKPLADVVEVRHEKWNIKSEIHQMFDDVDEELFVECPFCQRRYYVPFEFEDEKILEYAREEYPYCHCGAKMDGKDGAE